MIYDSLKKRLNTGIIELTKKIEQNKSDPVFPEQYKLLLESAHKSEERRKDIISFYITINWIYLPILFKLYEDKQNNLSTLITFASLLLLGIIICASWLKVINSYKNINYIHYCLIRTFETYLPTPIFSLRDKILEPGYEYDRANVIARKEFFIPLFFLSIYLISFVINLLDIYKLF